VFYPLGTNKIDVSTTTTEWPKGSKLISPFVYDDEDNLVGFCDTKAMTASGNITITLDYKHVEADFSSLPKDVVKVTAPNASFATIKWSDGVIEDITN
jgi:acetoacetate decarboxylase